MMRRAMLLATLAAVTALGACKKTGENEMQVETPDVDVNVSTDTTTVRTPDVDVGTTQDTVVVTRPTVDVNQPSTKKTP
jgi:hypothetical protein